MPELLEAADAFSSRRIREENATALNIERRLRHQTNGDRRHIIARRISADRGD